LATGSASDLKNLLQQSLNFLPGLTAEYNNSDTTLPCAFSWPEGIGFRMWSCDVTLWRWRPWPHFTKIL